MAHYNTITSDKDKDTALKLCVFGGFFGLHQFYVGKYGKGLLYLFTGGFFILGWFTDIISILLGTFRDNTGAPLRATHEQNNAPSKVQIINQEDTMYNQTSQVDNIAQIERLAKLKDQGIITQEEFDKKKKDLLI